jgi:hypothetical protein
MTTATMAFISILYPIIATALPSRKVHQGGDAGQESRSVKMQNLMRRVLTPSARRPVRFPRRPSCCARTMVCDSKNQRRPRTGR